MMFLLERNIGFSQELPLFGIKRKEPAQKAAVPPKIGSADSAEFGPPKPASSVDRPDLYVALVGGAGSDLQPIKDQLKAQFAGYFYEFADVKVSALIQEFFELNTTNLAEDDRARKLMDGGDEIREAAENGDGVVSLICAYIRSLRNDQPLKGNTVFIIDSIKNPNELKALDRVYGRNFYTVSVHAPYKVRKKNLSNKIAASCETPVSEEHEKRAKKIIDEDEHRDSTDLSQDVRSAFPEGDFFIDFEMPIETQIKRFVDLAFGHPFKTPTMDEFSMFAAKGVSFRSADLSRQVGANIVDNEGNSIATGCNEVPYPGGGYFYEGRNEAIDNRDYIIQYDPNSTEIERSVAEFIEIFQRLGLLKEAAETEKYTSNEMAAKLLRGELRHEMSDARIKNLIEFGRVVHAEMHALMQAARLGRAVSGATLYCTTFPCHGCAKHIIAAGIKEVVFIEPYPKSLTEKLYKDEIKSDRADGANKQAVVFRPFFGVAPVLFRRVFQYTKRKNKNGTIVEFTPRTAIPLGAIFGVNSTKQEKRYSSRLAKIREICDSK